MIWPFKHNWSTTYQVTYSYLTNVITSFSGREQRIAKRGEPRRSLLTRVTLDSDDARAFDRFVWSVGADVFDHVDPVTGQTSTVRLQDSITVDHATSGVSSADITLSVEPGTDTYAGVQLDFGAAYQDRLIFPFPVNWKRGVADAFSIPRRTIDFDSGRIAVDRPVAFNTRSTTLSLLRVGLDEVTEFVDFFRAMAGRQGEFLILSPLDDIEIVETVSATMTVEGGTVAAMYLADYVNAFVRVETLSGSIYYRRVLDAGAAGGGSLLQLSDEIPEPVNANTVRRCAWVRLGRFASDDLTVEWVTNRVAQTQVQLSTLPYQPSEYALGLDPLIDYYGWRFFSFFGELLDYTVNVEAPLIDDVMNRSELAFQFGDPLGYAVNSTAPKDAEWPH